MFSCCVCYAYIVEQIKKRRYRRVLGHQRIKLTCEFCGVEFETYPSRAHQRLCSRSCPGPAVGRWSSDLAYATGLIAADGCLEQAGCDKQTMRISFSNKEQELIDWMAAWMPRSHVYPASHGIYQVCSTWPNFYRFLLSIGLSPAKSLVMAELQIPDRWFFDFYRGLHDGDGTTHYHKGSLHLAVQSHAPQFRTWLRQSIERLAAVYVSEETTSLHLYGHVAERFASLVWKPGVTCLERKRPRR